MFIFGFFSPYKYSRARAICTYSSRTKLYRAPLIKSYFLFLILTSSLMHVAAVPWKQAFMVINMS